MIFGRCFRAFQSPSRDHLLNWPVPDWLADQTDLVAEPDGLVEWLEDTDTDAPACFYRLRGP